MKSILVLQEGNVESFINTICFFFFIGFVINMFFPRKNLEEYMLTGAVLGWFSAIIGASLYIVHMFGTIWLQ